MSGWRDTMQLPALAALEDTDRIGILEVQGTTCGLDNQKAWATQMHDEILAWARARSDVFDLDAAGAGDPVSAAADDLWWVVDQFHTAMAVATSPIALSNDCQVALSGLYNWGDEHRVIVRPPAGAVS